jgi:hypothetical protein
VSNGPPKRLNLSHAAGTERRKDFVRTDFGAWSQQEVTFNREVRKEIPQRAQRNYWPSLAPEVTGISRAIITRKAENSVYL